MKKFFTHLFLFSLLLLFASVANAQTSLSVKVYGLGETANKYGKLYVPQGAKYRIQMRPSANTTIGVYRAYVDGSDIYLNKLDVQGGYFWIDATEMAHALIVRSTSSDNVVAEVVTPEQDAMMNDEGYYYFDKSEARKNRLNYATSTVANETLLTSTTFNSKSIYVMANPARHGLAFALLEPVSSHRDLNAGSLYILTKKTSSSRQLNVVWADEDMNDNPMDTDKSVSTEINSIESFSDDDPVYSLEGRRLSVSEKAPVYIRKGRIYIGK